MSPEEVRAAIEKLVRTRLSGVVKHARGNATMFHIALDDVTASRLWPEPLGPDPFLACIHEPNGWVVHLMDHEQESKAYWTDIPDPTNDSILQLIPKFLEHRLDADRIQPVALMFDHQHNARKTYFETTAGPMIVHTRRSGTGMKRMRAILEVVDRQLFLESWLQDGLSNVGEVREIPELPPLVPRQMLQPVSKTARDTGLFYSHVGIAVYHFSLKRLRECLQKHCEQVPSVSPGRFSWRIRKPCQMEPDCLELLLAAGHERSHFIQSMSTPYGALQWRMLQAILSTAGFLLSKITDSDAICRAAYLPLTEWYVAEGSAAIRNEPPFGPHTRSVLKNTGMSRQKYLAELPDRLDLYFQELSTLVRFWTAMTKRERLSMRAFVSLANDAFEVLALNSDLKDYPVWSAHDLDRESYLPENAISIEEMMEGDARLLEHQEIAAFGLTPAEWKAWRDRFVAGTYAPAYQWLMQELSSAEVARVAIEIALTSPIDLICKDAVQGGEIYVEDCLPSWRLKKTVVALKSYAWPHERERAERAASREIGDQAGIPSPRRALVSMQGQNFTGESAWGLHGLPATMMDYFEYSRRELLRGLEIRRRDFLAFSRPDMAEIFQPMIEFYTDTALFNIAPGCKPSLPLYAKAILSLISNKLMLEIFFGEGRVWELHQIEASFLSRLAEEGITAKSINWPGLSNLATSLFGAHLSKLLNLN